MYKTKTRAAFEAALAAAPHGKVQQFIRRGMAHGAGTRPPRVVRKPRLPQIWSSKNAAKEFFGVSD